MRVKVVSPPRHRARLRHRRGRPLGVAEGQFAVSVIAGPPCAGDRSRQAAVRAPVTHQAALTSYGSKSRLGTQVAATLYTILETAKLHRIEPAKYLAAAVVAAGRGEVLLPWDWRP